MTGRLKSWIRKTILWERYKSDKLHREYFSRRERYRAVCGEKSLKYHPDQVSEVVLDRLRKRGYSPKAKPAGEIHTFAFIPIVSWHRSLLDELEGLGRLTNFDYTSLGLSGALLLKGGPASAEARKLIHEKLLLKIKEVHKSDPIDWMFIYANGWEIQADAIRRIQEEFGIPVVGMCLDDKHSWEGPFMGDQRGGQIDLAPVQDISWTNASVACEWYLAEGGNPLFMPDAYSRKNYYPLNLNKSDRISFLGEAYGTRYKYIQKLKANGVMVEAWGRGWENGYLGESPNKLYNQSLVNIGFGGIGYSDFLTNIKARSFEVTGAGGGIYITTYNADLAECFHIGREILCYHSYDELVELIRKCLADPEWALGVAERGYERSLKEHQWHHRFVKILKTIGILTGE